MRILTSRRFVTSAAIGLPALLLITAMLSAGCQEAPITGRRQLMIVPKANEAKMGATTFNQIIAEEGESQNLQYKDMVNRVGRRIAAASGESYEWEFRVIGSDVQNAFALPGGKVAVYEGIMPICKDEAGLATVISHEVAHVMARHGGERLSQQQMVNGIGMAIDKFTTKAEDRDRKLMEQAYGVASKFGVILPYSRKHELEADYIGMVLMAKAGYDPAAAADFWQRMTAAHAGGAAPPEFLSTHPSDDRRIAELRRRLPEALAAAGQGAESVETIATTPGGSTMQ